LNNLPLALLHAPPLAAARRDPAGDAVFSMRINTVTTAKR
jgi:hypothetical protein